MKKMRLQRGLTIVELMVILAVGVVIAAGALVIYFFQIRPSLYIDGKVRDFDRLVVSLEQIRGNYGNAYPEGTVADLGAIPENSNNPVERLLGARIGTYNSKYKGWRYECTEGGPLRVTVYVGDTKNVNQRYSVYNDIVQNNKGTWTCTEGYNGNAETFTCTQPASTCR